MGDVLMFPGADGSDYDSPIVRDWCVVEDCSAWAMRGKNLCRMHLREEEKNNLRKGPYSREKS